MHTLAAYMVASTNTAEDEQHTTQKDYQVNFFFKCQQILLVSCDFLSFSGYPTCSAFPTMLLQVGLHRRKYFISECHKNIWHVYSYMPNKPYTKIQMTYIYASIQIILMIFSSKQILPDIKIYFCDICKTPQQLFVCLFL